MNAQLVVTSSALSEATGGVPPSKMPPGEFHPYVKVKDSRGQSIRRLWQRNGRYVCQIRIPGKKNQTKVTLVDSAGVPVRTVTEAVAAMHELLKRKKENDLPILSRTPKLADWIATYLRWLAQTGLKSTLTIAKEAGALAKWSDRLGHIRIGHLRRAHVNEFIAWRKETDQVSNRTINLDVIALNNCLRHAQDEGRLRGLPTENWRPLEHRPTKRPLWSSEQIEKLCLVALANCENGQLLVDYIRFLAFSGARRNEALQVSWSDIDWDRKVVRLNTTKYSRPREVDLNPKLEGLVGEMQVRKDPVSPWLFPSPLDRESPAACLQGSLETARTGAQVQNFHFHDLRTYFISNCVMAGIDYMTIARWVGHKDGGVLIGRVYGHLNDQHAKRMAEKLWAE